MASFRILNQSPQYLLQDGRVNAGGKLFFYETDLTTPKDTWSDEAMTTLNSNPVVMDAAGRTLTDVWGDGEYGAEMTTSADVVIWTRNNVKASGDVGTAIPALVAGEFLSNNGSVLLWDAVLQVPDPTGHTDQVLYSDGELPYWAALPAEPTIPPLPTGGVVVTTTTILIGDTMIQTGSGSAPASGSNTTSVAVVFGTAMDSLQHVSITPTVTVVGTGGYQAVAAYTSPTGTGFTANFDTNAGSGSAGNIIVPVTFTYTAIGKKA